MKRVIVEGGSSAAGWWDEPTLGGWAGRLRADTMRHNADHIMDPITVPNFAEPGRTVDGALQTLSVVPRIFRAGPTAMVAAFGMNESKIMRSFEQPLIPLRLFATKTNTLAHTAAQLSIPLVLVGPTPFDETKTQPTCVGAYLEDDLTEEYGYVMQEAAHRYGAQFVDSQALFAPHEDFSLLHEDGYHPNELGHTILHGAIKDALISLGALPESIR